MQGKQFGLRRMVSAIVLGLTFFSLGALVAGCGESASQGLANNAPSASATSKPSQTATTPASNSSPASTATRASTASPASTATPAQPKATPTQPSPNASPTGTPDDLLYLVDKQHALPDGYVPSDLVILKTVPSLKQERVRSIILPALEKMIGDAKAVRLDLVVSSAFRSYSDQEATHAYWERTLGKTEADRVSALAGHSEHQLGTTLDITSPSVGNDLVEEFGTKPEGKWLKENSYKYGFVISYPEGKESVTGYAYEPWHVRYVGVETATTVYQKGVTLNEYLRAQR